MFVSSFSDLDHTYLWDKLHEPSRSIVASDFAELQEFSWSARRLNQTIIYIYICKYDNECMKRTMMWLYLLQLFLFRRRSKLWLEFLTSLGHIQWTQEFGSIYLYAWIIILTRCSIIVDEKKMMPSSLVNTAWSPGQGRYCSHATSRVTCKKPKCTATLAALEIKTRWLLPTQKHREMNATLNPTHIWRFRCVSFWSHPQNAASALIGRSLSKPAN